MTTTDVLGRLKTNRGLYFLFSNGQTDGSTEVELKVLDIAGNAVSVGEHCDGHTLNELGIQCSDGSILTTCILYDVVGGIVCSWRGNERTTWAHYNLESKGLSIPLKKGMVLKTTTAD